jgi:hypothetical protein
MHALAETRQRPHHAVARRTAAGAGHASPEAAVLALQRSAGNRATGMLLRQAAATVPAPAAPTIKSYGADRDVATVEMSDGTRYKVTRKRSTVPIVKPRGVARLGFGGDVDRIWMKASWCRGTRGEIRVGGDPQAEAKELLKNLAQGVANGGDAAEVKRIIQGAQIKPFIDWDIQKARSWKLTGEVTLTLDKGGFKEVKGKVGVDTGPIEGSVEGSADRDGGWSVTVKGTYTPGRKPKTKDDCPADELLFPYEYECSREHLVPAKEKQSHIVIDRLPEHRFVYFKYMSDEVNGKLTTKDDLKAIQDLYAGGYKLTNVQAFTSPEGLRDPSPRWKEGNRALSGRRAKAAMDVAAEQCLDGGCITGQISPPDDAELAPLDTKKGDGTTVEGSGRSLEDHVIALWESGDKDIAEQKSPAAEKRVATASGRHAKAEVIYEYLRRARLDFEKEVPREVIDAEAVPNHWETTAGNCPADVLQAARNAWIASGGGP